MWVRTVRVATLTSNGGKLLQAGRVLRIGDTGAGEFMDGVIDDVRIYAAALTDAQVADLARR